MLASSLSVLPIRCPVMIVHATPRDSAVHSERFRGSGRQNPLASAAYLTAFVRVPCGLRGGLLTCEAVPARSPTWRRSSAAMPHRWRHVAWHFPSSQWQVRKTSSSSNSLLVSFDCCSEVVSRQATQLGVIIPWLLDRESHLPARSPTFSLIFHPRKTRLTT